MIKDFLIKQRWKISAGAVGAALLGLAFDTPFLLSTFDVIPKIEWLSSFLYIAIVLGSAVLVLSALFIVGEWASFVSNKELAKAESRGTAEAPAVEADTESDLIRELKEYEEGVINCRIDDESDDDGILGGVEEEITFSKKDFIDDESDDDGILGGVEEEITFSKKDFSLQADTKLVEAAKLQEPAAAKPSVPTTCAGKELNAAELEGLSKIFPPSPMLSL